MNSELNSLLLDILAKAEQQGMSQKQLAERAQMQEASLSRLKSADDIRISTLSALARSVGLRLTLVPDSDLAEKLGKGTLF